MISIVIPFLNEEKNLRSLLPDVLSEIDQDVHLIFVNDGSSDKSETVLFEELKKAKNHISFDYVKHENRIGIGGAYRSALPLAKGSHLSMLASDNEDDIRDILNQKKLLANFRVVVFFNSNSDEARSLLRRIVSLTFRGYLNLRHNIKTMYFNAMGNIYPIELLKQIEIQSNGFFCLAELTIKVLKVENSVVHCPRTLRKRLSGEDKALTFRSLYVMINDYIRCNFDSGGKR